MCASATDPSRASLRIIAPAGRLAIPFSPHHRGANPAAPRAWHDHCKGRHRFTDASTGEQGKYSEMQNTLYENQNALDGPRDFNSMLAVIESVAGDKRSSRKVQ
ncbi:MAG: hypothetical protein V4710_01975 [Verrucomicrobiota bacterium]